MWTCVLTLSLLLKNLLCVVTGEPRSGDIREEMSVEDDMVTISGQKGHLWRLWMGKKCLSCYFTQTGANLDTVSSGLPSKAIPWKSGKREAGDRAKGVTSSHGEQGNHMPDCPTRAASESPLIVTVGGTQGTWPPGSQFVGLSLRTEGRSLLAHLPVLHWAPCLPVLCYVWLGVRNLSLPGPPSSFSPAPGSGQVTIPGSPMFSW